MKSFEKVFRFFCWKFHDKSLDGITYVDVTHQQQQQPLVIETPNSSTQPRKNRMIQQAPQLIPSNGNIFKISLLHSFQVNKSKLYCHRKISTVASKSFKFRVKMDNRDRCWLYQKDRLFCWIRAQSKIIAAIRLYNVSSFFF